jgi:DHA1 family multidrug resistance protein-like MFS transporter
MVQTDRIEDAHATVCNRTRGGLLKWLAAWPKGVPLLLVNSFLMSVGFYALIPNLSVYLTHVLQWSPLLAGALLMVRQFGQQGPMMLTGMIADRVGYRATLSIGFLIRGIGFAMFAFNTSVVWIFLSAIVSGIGGSLFEPTGDAALATLTDESSRSRTYAVKKVSDNLGMVFSALIGSLLVSVSFRLLSLVCGAVFVLAGLLTYFRLPSIRVQVKPVPWRHMWGTVSRDKPFIHFVAVMVGYFFMYMQLYLTIPDRVVEMTHQASSVSIVFLTLSVMMILFQVPINTMVSKYNAILTVQWGLLSMGGGLFLFGLSNSIWVLLVGIILFSVGVMTVQPASFDVTSQLSDPKLTATYFGFYYLAMAIGGALSQGMGGLLLQVGAAIGVPSLVWWVAGAVAVLSAAGAGPLREALLRHRESQVQS